MTDPEELPPPLGRLVDRLRADRFRVVGDVYDAQAFGNRIIDLARGRRRLRLIRDRSQWFTQLRMLGGWVDSAWVVAVLGRSALREDVPSPEELTSTALEHMPSDPMRRLVLRTRIEVALTRRDRARRNR